MTRNQRRQIASAILGGPLTHEELQQDYVWRDSHDHYLLILPSGARALLDVPSRLDPRDRAVIQALLDLTPALAPEEPPDA